MHQYLLDFLKELEKVIPPPENCHHALTFAQYGSSECGWDDRLALQVNIAGTFSCVFLSAADLEKSVVELTEEIRAILRAPTENAQLGVSFGQYTGKMARFCAYCGKSEANGDCNCIGQV